MCGGGSGGRVRGLRLVLLFAMRDDVTQVPVVQIATHIWWESGKHLLDLGKEPGVSLDQGRMGSEPGVTQARHAECPSPFSRCGGVSTKARPAATPTHPCSPSKESGETLSADPLKTGHFPGMLGRQGRAVP